MRNWLKSTVQDNDLRLTKKIEEENNIIAKLTARIEALEEKIAANKNRKILN